MAIQVHTVEEGNKLVIRGGGSKQLVVWGTQTEWAATRKISQNKVGG